MRDNPRFAAIEVENEVMEQLLVFIGNHPILVGAFAVVLAALIATETARLTRAWKELDTAQAILLINRQDPLILDVSNSTDFANGHILNAENMPPSRIEAGNSRFSVARRSVAMGGRPAAADPWQGGQESLEARFGQGLRRFGRCRRPAAARRTPH
jgi:hypothetical protein